MFDGIQYFKNLANCNLLAVKHGFHVGECSSLEAIEPIMDEYQTKSNFILVDDTIDASVVTNGSGWFNRRVFTVAILARHRWNDTKDRNDKLNLCREIFRQFLTRLVLDKENFKYNTDLCYMRTEILRYREMNTYSMDGATGVVFMLPVDEPTDLIFRTDEWKQ